jgi:glycosyltransferase involved in cell wall biosynthesis
MRGLPAQETADGVAITRTACIRLHRHYTTAAELATTLWSTYREAARMIREDRPDLIHCHFVFPSGLIAWLLSRRFGIPFVLTAHGSDIPGYNPDRFRRLHKILKPIWRRIVRSATVVTSPSRYLGNLIRLSAPRLPIYVVPNGYSARPRPPRAKRKLVLVVARLFPRKGVQKFIEAVAGSNSDWEFVVAGDGPYMDTLRAQARASRSPVRFVGFLDEKTLAGYYDEARIFVFPSIRENFPMVLLEAMEAGCAVITTDAEGCAEVVENAGVVVPSSDAQALRDALSSLMTDEARCEDLSRRARARAELFRWERTAELYRAVFERVLTNNSTMVRILSVPKSA